jgi:hypothetical protein
VAFSMATFIRYSEKLRVQAIKIIYFHKFEEYFEKSNFQAILEKKIFLEIFFTGSGAA